MYITPTYIVFLSEYYKISPDDVIALSKYVPHNRLEKYLIEINSRGISVEEFLKNDFKIIIKEQK